LARKTWIVPNAVEPGFFDVPRAPAHPLIVLCVGHISVRKNQVEFIRALDPLATHRQFQIVFLGNAPRTDPYCAEFFSAIGTRPWCVYGGLADRAQLKNHYTAAGLLALPSLEDNCPMAVLEAAAAGVPVAAANVGGVPELVEHGVTGVLFDPTNAVSTRDAIGQILDRAEEARARAATARQRALERYHPKAIARQHLEVYRELLNTSL
jgi:glycogen(starch) synthase